MTKRSNLAESEGNEKHQLSCAVSIRLQIEVGDDSGEHRYINYGK